MTAFQKPDTHTHGAPRVPVVGNRDKTAMQREREKREAAERKPAPVEKRKP